MTTITTITAIDPPVVRAPHLATILGCSVATLDDRLSRGKIPRPDTRGNGNCKLWRVSTIRAWRPDIADAVAALARIAPARGFTKNIPLNPAA